MSNTTKQMLKTLYELTVRTKKKIKTVVTTMDEQEYNRCISLIEQNKN